MKVNLLAPQEFGCTVVRRLMDEVPSKKLHAVIFRFPAEEDLFSESQEGVVTISLSNKWRGLDGEGVEFIISCAPLENMIVEQLSSAEINIIVGAFFPGVCRLSYLSELSKRKNVSCIVVGSIPAAFEGRMRRERVINNVRKCPADKIITVDGAYYERWLKGYNQSATLDNWKDTMVMRCILIIKEILDMTSVNDMLIKAEMIAQREASL